MHGDKASQPFQEVTNGGCSPHFFVHSTIKDFIQKKSRTMAVATDAVTFSYNTETVTFSNLGPLTTAFSPPPNCIASQTGTFQFISTASTYWDCAALTPVPGTPGELDFKYLEEPSCMPYGSEASSLWVAPSNFYQTLFSPGIACPSGWDTSAVVTYAPSATGTSIGVSGAGQWASFLTDAMPTGGTQVFCCPR